MRLCMLLTLLLAACGSKSSSQTIPTDPPASSSAAVGSAATDCVKTGCSGTVCAEPGNEVVTTCEFKAEYACYRDAECKRQDDGHCGWTQTPALTSCLQNPPAAQGGAAPM